MPYTQFQVFNQIFLVDDKYQFIRELGQGAYGVVCAAKDTSRNVTVAIKKITKVFDKNLLARRALREIKLLKHFNGHDNITSIHDMDIINVHNFNDIYIFMDYMEADMHQIVRSEQALTDAHFQYFMYQICRGLKFIHSASVIHRDLKPGNLLLNADCELKICDFGLARGFLDNDPNNSGMTEYVATRWYRAPEIMLSYQKYSRAIDMWSVGCIFAELLGGKPLFKGRDYVDQLNQILAVLGTPNDEMLERIGSERAQMYIKSLPKMQKIPFSKLFPQVSVLAIDLLERLLKFDPVQRITVQEVLSHPYLSAYHDAEDEPQHSKIFDFSFEKIDNTDEMRKLIAKEVMEFKALKVDLKPLSISVHHRHMPSNASASSATTAVSHHSTSSISSMSSGQTLVNSQQKSISSMSSGQTLVNSQQKSISSMSSGQTLVNSQQKSISSMSSGQTLSNSQQKSISSISSGQTLSNSQQKSISSISSGQTLSNSQLQYANKSSHQHTREDIMQHTREDIMMVSQHTREDIIMVPVVPSQ